MHSTEIDTLEMTTVIMTEEEAMEVFKYLIDKFGRNRVFHSTVPEDPSFTGEDV